VKPIQRKSLLSVDSLTETPMTFCTKRHLSLRETADFSSTSASSSLLACSSSLGFDPGCRFGVSALPSWNYVGFVWTGSIYATAAASIVASS
jgi:hypothetical protein